MSARKRLAVVGMALLVVAGGIVIMATALNRGARNGRAASWTVTKVARGAIAVTVPASGTFEPDETTTIRPDSSMPQRKITSIPVNEGDRVAAGQIVATVDSSLLDLQVKSAQANLQAQTTKLKEMQISTPNSMKQAESALQQAGIAAQSAQYTYDSTKSLLAKGLASQQQLLDAQKALLQAQAQREDAQSTLDQLKQGTIADQLAAQESARVAAESAYEQARLALDSTRIRTQVDGVVSQVNVNLGDLVGPETSICVVSRTDPMILVAQVNESDIAGVAVGQSAAVTPWGYPDLRLAGVVTQIAQMAVSKSNVTSLEVDIQVPNKDGRLLWGMNADAEVTTQQAGDALVLPNAAILQRRGDVAQVQVADGSETVRWDVKVGITDGKLTQIVAGLDEGDQVAIESRASPAAAPAGGAQNNRNAGPAVFRAFR